VNVVVLVAVVVVVLLYQVKPAVNQVVLLVSLHRLEKYSFFKSIKTFELIILFLGTYYISFSFISTNTDCS
jgi:hypothetical protein